MNYFKRYIPFSIITLLIYGLIFVQKEMPLSQEVDLLAPKKIVQLISLKKENKVSSAILISTAPLADLDSIQRVKKTDLPKKVNLPLDFTETKAIDSATLKGTTLDEMLYLHLNLPKRPLKITKMRKFRD